MLVIVLGRDAGILVRNLAGIVVRVLAGINNHSSALFSRVELSDHLLTFNQL